MTQAEELARFGAQASYDSLSSAARMQLRIRVLDSLGCALGALDGEPVRLARQQVDEFGGAGLCSLIGGGRTAPDRAAFYNGALVRYLDFNDSYLAKGETCHPSDNLAPVLAASEYAGVSGREFLAALALAYQVQCRLSDAAPVRDKGFDHTTQGSYAVAAGVSRALGLDAVRTANAVAISGTAFNALRVTRTGTLSHWKGLAYPNTAFGCTHAAFLAMRGVTGPPEVFEGNKGFMYSIAGPFSIDWRREDLERVTRTILKKYNADSLTVPPSREFWNCGRSSLSRRTISSASKSRSSTSPTRLSAAARKGTSVWWRPRRRQTTACRTCWRPPFWMGR
jgi:2-methylcitrate dehydratase